MSRFHFQLVFLSMIKTWQKINNCVPLYFPPVLHRSHSKGLFPKCMVCFSSQSHQWDSVVKFPPLCLWWKTSRAGFYPDTSNSNSSPSANRFWASMCFKTWTWYSLTRETWRTSKKYLQCCPTLSKRCHDLKGQLISEEIIELVFAKNTQVGLERWHSLLQIMFHKDE